MLGHLEIRPWTPVVHGLLNLDKLCIEVGDGIEREG